MRIDAANLLLSLAALSSLPLGSGRALPDYDLAAEDYDPFGNVTLVERAYVPPKVPGRPKPDAPDPVVPPGGNRNPNTPGGDRTPDGPAPLVPGDRNPNTPNDKSPDGLPARELETDLWCPSDMLREAAKRKRADSRRSQTCGRRSERSASQRRDFMSSRGRRAYEGERSYPTVDYTSRIDGNYRMRQQRTPEDSIEDTIPRMGYEDRYGFPTDLSRWQTYSTHSNGNNLEPVSQMSYHRSRHNDEDNVAILAHQRFANRDANRYELNNRGNPREDRDGNYINRDDWRERSVPVYQLSHEGSRRAGMHNPPPDRYHFISENIKGREGQRTIDEAFEALPGRRDPRQRDRLLLRRDSDDAIERDHWTRASGTDNAYSHINSARRNREYADYDPHDIDLYEGPEYGMSQRWERRRRRGDGRGGGRGGGQ